MAFDVITPTKLGQGEIGLAVSTFRTTPASSVDMIKNIDIANNGASSAVVSVYLVPDGGSASDANVLMPSISIPKNNMFQWTGVQVMDAGGSIQAVSSIVDVAINISGGNAV